MLYAVIVAGGQGTRLWPVSRKNSPKQLRPFMDGETMLQKTYKRMANIVQKENIFLITNGAYADEFKQQLDNIQDDHLILEPVGRSTAAAVGLAAAVLAKHDPQAIMVNAWADHFIKNEDEYRQKIADAIVLLEEHPDMLIDIVAEPEYAATGFGYLEAGQKLGEQGSSTLYHVMRFVEKPELAVAEEYLKAGNFYWNTAMFVWRVDTILALYKEHMPEMYEGLMKIQAAWGTPEQEIVLNEVFPELEAIAIDYAIFEKTDKIALIPANLGWRDVGTWHAVHDILSKVDEEGLIQKGRVRAIDTTDALIFNEHEGKLIAVVGMSDVVIVDTKDALLVMKKSKDQDIKKILKQLEEEGQTSLL